MMNNTLLLEKALTQVGTKEFVGVEDNPEVIKYFEAVGYGNLHDETAWCSAFMNWVAKECGLEYSGLLTARSWLGVGEAVEEPQIGDVVIFWRVSPNSWQGHVGIWIREKDQFTYCLGGNQSNKVGINAYYTDRVLGYRRLKKIT